MKIFDGLYHIISTWIYNDHFFDFNMLYKYIPSVPQSVSSDFPCIQMNACDK